MGVCGCFQGVLVQMGRKQAHMASQGLRHSFREEKEVVGMNTTKHIFTLFSKPQCIQ